MAITKATASSIAPAAKGDLVVGSATNDAAVLAVGANGTTLVADSAEATGMKWAAASSGGMTLLTTHTLSGSTSTISGISGSYKNLFLIVQGVSTSGADTNLRIDPNGSNAITSWVGLIGANASATTAAYESSWYLNYFDSESTDTNNAWAINIYNYASTTNYKPINLSGYSLNNTPAKMPMFTGGAIRTNSAITSLDFVTLSGSWTTGTVLLYGVS